MLRVQRWSDAGTVQVLASTLPRAQNRAAKGSTLLQKRSTLPIQLYNLSIATVLGSNPASNHNKHGASKLKV